MAKLNRNYVSIYDLMVIADFPLMRRLHYKLYKTRPKNIEANFLTQMKGAFQPIAEIAKDAVDTFKPYRSSYYAKRDAKQPIYGLGNLLKGVIYLICVPIALIPCLCVGLLSGYSFLFAAPLSWLIDGILSILQGLTQLAATPLGWLKMGIRGLITAYYYFNDDLQKKGFLSAENRPGILSLVNVAQKESDRLSGKQDLTHEDMELIVLIAEKIREKYRKAVYQRKEETNFDNDKKTTTLDDTYVSRISYLKLFGFQPGASLEKINSDQELPETEGCAVQ